MDNGDVATISREELRGKIERGDDFAIAETPDGQSYERPHLPGAINLPLDETGKAEEASPDKGTGVVVYRMGPIRPASEKADRGLEARGYTDVKDYAGGKKAWIRHGGLPYKGASNDKED
ncbi:MAG: rhodanese-like domain-containing protein [Rubrobacteraceae bacterium]